MDQGQAIVFAALIAAVSTVVGVWIGGRIGGSAAKEAARVAGDATREAARLAQEEARADRADAALAREEAREDARTARFVDQKRQLLTEFWTACDRHKREVEAQVAWRRWAMTGHGGDDPGVGSTEPARQAFLALTLVSAHDLIVAAEELYSATVRLGSEHAYVATERGLYEVDETSWLRDFNVWGEAAAHFENAARSDLRGEGASDA